MNMKNEIKYNGNNMIETFKDGRKRVYRLSDYSIIDNEDLKNNGFSIHCSNCNKEFRSNIMKTHYINEDYLCLSCNKLGNRNPFFGKVHSDHFKHRLSVERKGSWCVGVNNGMNGRCNYDIWSEKFGIDEADRLQAKSNRKNSISHKGILNGFYGKHHSDETKKLLRKRSLEYCKNHPEVAENSRKRIMGMIESGKMFKKNSIERATEQWLSDNNIDARYNFILDGKYQYDFRLLNVKTIIEVHGDFWHGNPKVYCKSELSDRQKFKQERDVIKLTYANSKGYDIVYIWERDIRKGDFTALKGL